VDYRLLYTKKALNALAEIIHWPDLDEDLSMEGLLRGAPAPKTSVPAK
jgi:Protein of unknown function (DUF2442)